MAGGAIPDPVMALARVLASLVDEHGDVAIDGALGRRATRRPRPSARRSRASTTTPSAFARAMGVRPGRASSSATRRTTLHERLWFRPSLTVIGIDGHPIKGSSNQIVARAPRAREPAPRARPGTRPRARPAARARRARTCRGVSSCASRALEGAPAWQTDPTGPAFDAARRALRAGFGTEPVLMGVGGSIPFVGPFADAFGGIPALLLGPADPRSRIHGENESLHLGDWRKLIASEVHLLAELADAASDAPGSR